MNIFLIFEIWFIIGLMVIMLIKYIAYLYKKNKLQEFFKKIPHYGGTIQFSDGKKIKYRFPDYENE